VPFAPGCDCPVYGEHAEERARRFMKKLSKGAPNRTQGDFNRVPENWIEAGRHVRILVQIAAMSGEVDSDAVASNQAIGAGEFYFVGADCGASATRCFLTRNLQRTNWSNKRKRPMPGRLNIPAFSKSAIVLEGSFTNRNTSAAIVTRAKKKMLRMLSSQLREYGRSCLTQYLT
jgi:hypothetical protein